jgi:G patch domain-containing protein 1
MKMFGQLTRTKHVWIPDPLICKRFNVMNPYPEQRDIDASRGLMERENELQQELRTLTEQTHRMKSSEAKVPERLAFEKEQEAKFSKDDTTMVAEIHDDADEGPAIDYERPPMDLFKSIFEDNLDENWESTQVGEEIESKSPEFSESSSAKQTSEANTPNPSFTLDSQAPRRIMGPTFPQWSDLNASTKNLAMQTHDEAAEDISIESRVNPFKGSMDDDLNLKKHEHKKKEKLRKHRRHHKDKERKEHVHKKHRKSVHRERAASEDRSSSSDSDKDDDVVIWTEKAAC